MRTTAAGLLLSVLVVFSANNVAVAGDAGRESPFSVGIGARALAMGGAFTSLADDATAVFYNPAGLASLDRRQVSFMHMTMLEGASFDYAGYAHPDSALGGFGIAYLHLGTDDIIRRRDFVEIGRFDYATSLVLLSYGGAVMNDLNLGASAKVLHQSLADFSDYGVGLDFGAHGRVYRDVFAGLMIRDLIPPSIELGATSETVPLSVIGGLSWRGIDVTEQVSAVAVVELEKTEDRSVKIHAGIEGIVDGSYALRLGYDRDNVSLGVGAAYRGFKIDYAYKFIDYVGDSHRFSLSYLFGGQEPGKEEAPSALMHQPVPRETEPAGPQRFESLKNKADDLYQRSDLDSALVYYHRALAFDEGNEAVRARITAIESELDRQREESRQQQQHQLQLRQSTAGYFIQAQDFLEKKNFNGAVDALARMLEIDPDNADARALKAKVQEAMSSEIALNLGIASSASRSGEYLTEIEAYNRILGIDPNHQQARQARREAQQRLTMLQELNLGIELFGQGNYVDSRRHLSAVLAIDDSDPVALEYIRRLDQALAQPPTLEQIQQDEPVWQLYLEGLRHMRNKDYQKAIDAWEKVLQAYPNNPNTLDNLEQARLRLKSDQGD